MYTAIKTGGHEAYKYKNFVADTVADIENISITDCCMGSTVKVIETGIEYMLNSNDEWVINLSTGSGSGDSSTQIAQLQEQITTLKEKITSQENIIIELQKEVEELKTPTVENDTIITPTATVDETANTVIFDSEEEASV